MSKNNYTATKNKQAIESQLVFGDKSVRVFHEPTTDTQWLSDRVFRPRVLVAHQMGHSDWTITARKYARWIQET